MRCLTIAYYIIANHIIMCHVVVYRIIPLLPISRYIMQHDNMSRDILSAAISYCMTMIQFTLHHIISYYIIQYEIVLYHCTLYRIVIRHHLKGYANDSTSYCTNDTAQPLLSPLFSSASASTFLLNVSITILYYTILSTRALLLEYIIGTTILFCQRQHSSPSSFFPSPSSFLLSFYPSPFFPPPLLPLSLQFGGHHSSC